ncbi:hypothetical protein AAHB37_17195 [Glutamicibacter halophytocola]|uniref:hypothetical protein n=1 Tax=Glutamicibacter halophytocola TaxID=1933880 RepID=UPI00321A1472
MKTGSTKEAGGVVAGRGQQGPAHGKEQNQQWGQCVFGNGDERMGYRGDQLVGPLPGAGG